MYDTQAIARTLLEMSGLGMDILHDLETAVFDVATIATNPYNAGSWRVLADVLQSVYEAVEFPQF